MISNICRANFNGGRTAQGNNRYQWDYGQILEISGIENLPDPFTAQFSNYPVLGTAKTAVGTGGSVEIPNEYFVSGQNIYCFIVLHTDEDDGRTVYVATIPVTKRPQPIDDPITPTQQSTIDTAIAALQAGVARAEGYAESAEEQAGIAQSAATTATEAATRAEGAVADVEAAATRAEQAADGAEASATAAEASATGAETAKTAAEAAKDAAETAAASAEQSATDAGNYAGLAEEAETAAAASATAAEASATAAAASATQASGSASQAAQKASEAASSATAAQTSATNAEQAKTDAQAAQAAAEAAQASAEEAEANAEQSATTAEWYAERVERFLPTDTASGEIASFPDGADGVPMQSVVVTMEPVQDLHGYDSPWPAGGGKNKFDPSVYSKYLQADGTFRGQAGWVNVIYINIPSSLLNITCTFSFYADMTNAGTLTIVLAQAVVGGTNKNGNLVQNGSVGRSTVTFTPTSTEDYVHITFGSNGANDFTFYNIQLEASSAVTDFAPYSNICPISGRTGADIEHTGVNVWDEEWELGQYNNATGLPISANDCIRTKNPISVKPNVTYRTTYGNGNMQAFFYKADETYIGNAWIGATNLITTPDECALMRFRLASAYDTTYNHDISINYPATNTAYEPYQGDTLSVTFPSEAGTVYGGTLDVVGGELVVDRAMVDLGTLTWNDSGSPSLFYSTTAPLFGTGGSALINSSATGYNNISEIYVNAVVVLTNPVSGRFQVANSQAVPILRVCDDRFTNASEFAEAINGTKAVFMLYEPITYHLTPQEVRTLLGTNNVWSDAGDTAVTYKADVQLYIDKRISALS